MVVCVQYNTAQATENVSFDFYFNFGLGNML